MVRLPERIVYVDDEQDLREILRVTLESFGYEGALATCGSGKELLQRLRVLQPELILLDLKMPDMDGPATIAQLKMHEMGRNIPIVFVTGSIKLEMLERYKPLGVIGVIHKPLDLGALTDNISALWCEYLGEEAVVAD
ncbi:MAG TPA: response regulator [Alphaproteobacteria bacterium]|nr:response regulator [Alphaproteobacteria bacterium]USO05904.1 MAG: response regulator [Rhodospirillales bacterium]HOO81336.1 response regulator [Alphaproteobacteria bacterium]